MPYITNDQLTAINQRLAAVERRQRQRRIAIALVLVAAAALAVHSDITRTPFASGDVISASAVNAQLDQIYDLINGDTTNAGGTLMPIAFGSFDHSGSKLHGTGNISASDGASGRVDINVANEDDESILVYVISTFVAGSAVFSNVQPNGTVTEVYTYTDGGVPVDGSINVAVWKP